MMKEAEGAIKDADVTVYLIDPKANDIKTEIDELKGISGKRTVIVAINKIDLVAKEELLPLIEKLTAMGIKTIIPLSALKHDGIEALETVIIKELPLSPPLYPEDTLTEHTERFIVSETIREKLFKFTRQEIPYSSLVAIDDFKERSATLSAVYAVIYLEKESQKGIVIGAKGSMIKKIGESARKELEENFGRKFYLDIKVKIKKDWTKDEKFIKDISQDMK